MGKYIGKRLLQVIPVLLVLTLLVYALMYASPGDAAQKKLSAQGIAVSEETLAAEREAMGLNRPFAVRYLSWLLGAVTGNLGESYQDGQQVGPKLLKALGNTAILSVCSLLFALIVSLPLGTLSAVKKNSVWDKLIGILSFAGNAIPGFLLSTMLIYWFCMKVKWFPVIADGTFQGLLLPVLALGIPLSGRFIRQIRAELLAQLSREYVLQMHLRGVKERIILFRHVLRNACGTLLNLTAVSVGTLMGGSVIIETMFRWPGLGKLAMDAITDRDLPVLMGFVLVTAVLYALLNLTADILCRLLDRHSEGGGA